MLFVCLGYHNEAQSESMSPDAAMGMMDECFTYDDKLRDHGHFAGGHALQSSSSARTVRWGAGRALVTNGPYAETKEQIGGILLLEALDLNHAVELMCKHPGVKQGPFEIRPVADLTAMMRESAARRAAKS